MTAICELTNTPHVNAEALRAESWCKQLRNISELLTARDPQNMPVRLPPEVTDTLGEQINDIVEEIEEMREAHK